MADESAKFKMGEVEGDEAADVGEYSSAVRKSKRKKSGGTLNSWVMLHPVTCQGEMLGLVR